MDYYPLCPHLLWLTYRYLHLVQYDRCLSSTVLEKYLRNTSTQLT